MAWKPPKSLDTIRSKPCGPWCHRCGFARKNGCWSRGQNGSMVKDCPFAVFVRTEYRVVFSAFLDTVLGIYNMIDWLSTGGVVAYSIHHPCLKTSERQGAWGPGARPWVSNTWDFCLRQKYTEKRPHWQISDLYSQIEIKKWNPWPNTMFPLFLAEPMFTRRGMHGFESWRWIHSTAIRMRGRHGPLNASNNAYDMGGATDFALVGFRYILKVPIKWQSYIVA